VKATQAKDCCTKEINKQPFYNIAENEKMNRLKEVNYKIKAAVLI
jgi:hypothetical protein